MRARHAPAAKGMLRLTRRCRVCSRQANWGQQGALVPQRCRQHSLAGDVDLVHKRCDYIEGCHVLAFYGASPGAPLGHGASLGAPLGRQGKVANSHQDSRELRFCAKHRLPGDVDLSHRLLLCRLPGCTRRASYGTPDVDGSIADADSSMPGRAHARAAGRMPTHCAEHKLPAHVDLMHRRCAAAHCFKVPIFGSPTDGVARWCKKHCNMELHVDLMHGRCVRAACVAAASFGVLGDKRATHCSSHMTEGMVLLTPDARRKSDANWELSFALAANDLAATAAAAGVRASSPVVNPVSRSTKASMEEAVGGDVGGWVARHAELLAAGLLTGEKANRFSLLLKSAAGGGAALAAPATAATGAAAGGQLAADAPAAVAAATLQLAYMWRRTRAENSRSGKKEEK